MSEVESLFFNNRGQIVDQILADSRLFIQDAENIVDSLQKYLPAYCDGLTDEAFLAWGLERTRPAAQKLGQFYDLVRENDWAIMSGVRSALGCGKGSPNLFEDNEATASELANEVRMLVFLQLDDFLQPGPAKSSSRLYALARMHAGFHTKKIRVRHNAVRRRLAEGRGFLGLSPSEVLTDEQLAATKVQGAEWHANA